MTLLWKSCAKCTGILHLGRLSIVGDPTGTEFADLGYFAKDKICHYCKETGHLRNDCPKIAQKQNGKMCEYLGFTMKVGYTTDKCWEDPKNKEDRPAKLVSRIKKNTNEASSVEIFL